MARFHLMERTAEQQVMDELHASVGRRLEVSSLAPCPVEFTMSFVGMCATQSCGKCTPCRVGLRVLRHMLSDVLTGRATMGTIDDIERLARGAYLSSDCAIGYEAGAMALRAVRGFRDDFVSHVSSRSCFAGTAPSVPCKTGCPAGVDVPGYLALVRVGRNADAVRLIRKDNPFPLVCGLVCEHPCERNCRRGMVDDPINIRALKRFAVEHEGTPKEPVRAASTGRRVAVVGGGPAGLSCAYYLTLMGHSVTVFEARHHLGGMLRYGIPAYRLPREKLDEEISWIVGQGVEVRLGEKVDGESLSVIRGSFDAVYLAIGAHADKKLGIAGEELPGVESAVDMLRSIGNGKMPDFSGQRVCVVGGGNVAMDVARSSIRCGAERVYIVYRRRAADMTAQDEEIEGARAEGCELLELNAPVRIEAGEDGRVASLVVQPQVIGEWRRGRPAPHAADASERHIPCDRVIVAIGQAIESAPFESLGIPTSWGRISTQTDASIAELEGVFSGGDCQTGPATVIKAINAGKVAAGNIDNYLGFDHKIELDVDIPSPQLQDLGHCARCETTLREAGERSHDFQEIELGLTDEEALQEASRCLRCDHFGFGSFRGGREIQW
ncbi:NAD(P)-binding protein [Olsenella urininfantis]|uniref:NAD(P)-binding protein n=1 Tax=Olsenella urininfantis TaxID=1871033 RepID=UPI000984E5EC|nr:NAD(P)-binding protein [Olsenella urininfantis]